MSKITPLNFIDLREAWPNEARDFTPWLAQNLDALATCLEFDLRLIKKEPDLGVAGRADILAERVGFKSKVIIENQLEASDNSHCLRLLGYAASVEADVLIWIAKSFTEYHRGILNWLNTSDTVALYGVVIKAYKVDDNLFACFDLAIEPASQLISTKMHINTLHANFYNPVRSKLAQAQLHPVGRGGFRGRWRSFSSGYKHVDYVVKLTKNEIWAYLAIYGTATNGLIYKNLVKNKKQIDAKLKAKWQEEDSGGNWLSIKLCKSMEVDDWKNNPEPLQRWIVASLIKLRDVLQPVLQSSDADSSR